VRGDPEEVAQAIEVLKVGVVALGGTFELPHARDA